MKRTRCMSAGPAVASPAGASVDLQHVAVALQLSATAAGCFWCARDPLQDALGVVALQPLLALHHHLRREDRPAARRLGIGALPRGVPRPAEGVLPAEIVPVVDVQRQRDHPVEPGELGQQRIRRRAGRAALAGEEFEHHRSLPAPWPPRGTSTSAAAKTDGRRRIASFRTWPLRPSCPPGSWPVKPSGAPPT